MNIYLVCDSLFDPKKVPTILRRFEAKCDKNDIDALCITISSSDYLKEINQFKAKFSSKFPIIVGNDLNLTIYNETYKMNSSGIRIHDDETIYAMDDSVCILHFDKNNQVDYTYQPFDVFMNLQGSTKHTESLSSQNIAKDFMNGQPIAIPLQKFLDIIEDSVDEDTKEKIRRAKQEYNEKTKN